jgi:DsbC/DsbD-like thiol-disulfide interchange protein
MEDFPMTLARSRCVVGLLALALPALFVANARPVLAQAKKSDAVVKTTATADKPDADGKQTVTITLDIEKPWHLYANPPGNEDVENAQTVITVTSKTKPENVKVEYPPGKLHKDPLGDFKIYEGKVVIKAHVKRAKGDSGPLEVSIKMQACSDKTCLIPSTVKVPVP